MLVQRWNALLLLVAISLFCFDGIRASCTISPDVFEYKFEQANCLGSDPNFPSTIAAAGDMTMPTTGVGGGVGICSSGLKEVNGVQQSYLNGIFGVSPTGSTGIPQVALVSSNSVLTSGIKEDFNGGFTLEFFVRPHFDYAEFTGSRSYLLAEVGNAIEDNHSCFDGELDFVVYVTVSSGGSVQFRAEHRGSSGCTTPTISMAAAPGQTSVFEKDVVHHVTIRVNLNVGSGPAKTDFMISVTKVRRVSDDEYVAETPATGFEDSSGSPSTAGWSNDFQLRLGASYESSVNGLLPWDGDILYASGYSSAQDLSCRANNFDNIVATTDQRPVAGEVTFTTDEDVPLEGSIADFGFDYENDAFNIAFTQLPPANQGVLKVDNTAVQVNTNILSTKAYTFEPAENFNGDVTFQARASTTGGVTLISASRAATIAIAAVNDRPVVIEPDNPYIVRPGLEVQITLQATDVESIDNADYEVVIGTLDHQGKVYNGVCSGKAFTNGDVKKTIAGKLNAQGEATICYVPNPSTQGLSNSDVLFSDTMDVTVEDVQGGLTDTKTYSVDVVNALQGCGQTARNAPECAGKSRYELDEDPTVTVLQLHGSDTADRQIDFKITKLPLHGKLYLDDNNAKGAEITALNTVIVGPAVNSKNGVSVKIHYQPNENYFNARSTTTGISNQDLFGANIATCSDRITFDGYCPDTVGFKVQTKDANSESPESTFPLYVRNVADEYSVGSEPRLTDITIRPRLVDGKTEGDKAPFNFTVDKFIDSVDGDCFLYSIKVERTQARGSLILSDVEGLPSTLQVKDGVDCLENGCSSDLTATGPPSALNHFVKALTVGIPQGVKSADIRFIVRRGSNPIASGEPDYEETITVFKDETGIDLNTNEIPYAVIFGGTGVGLFVLSILIFMVVKTYRGGRAGARELRHLGHLAADKIHDMETGGHAEDDPDHIKKNAAHHKKHKKKKKAPTHDARHSQKLSKEEYDVDDSIFDWEKHIDRRTGDVYFFNPKTGESRWDPPEVVGK